MTKEFFERLENWEGGKANGYYEPFTDEIHVLRSESMMFRVLLHERIHASRKDKLTCKLGALMQVNSIRNFLFGTILVFAVLTPFISILPFLSVAALFSILLFCVTYEEYKADLMVAQSVKEIKLNMEKKE